MNKRIIRNFCRDNNLAQPRFSGHSKTMFVTSNVNYLQEQQLIEFSIRIGYSVKFE
jgi:hypothetical protein